MKSVNFLNRGFLNLLFPLRCSECGKRLSPESDYLFFCKDCISSIPFRRGKIKAETYAVCKYDGIVKKTIHRLKYGKQRFLAQTLGLISADFYRKNLESKKIDFIVPVPLHRVRREERGFNQSELIALALAKNLNIPLSLNNLVRIRNTPSQTLIKKKERLKNLKGAFRVKKPYRFLKRSVLLIDDVYTTGATTDECRKVLKKVGTEKVFILTFAS